MSASLYTHLSVAGAGGPADRGRTRRSASDTDTVDDDRGIVDFYGQLGTRVGTEHGIGRTRFTREERETVDEDRTDGSRLASLMGPVTDLYAALAQSVPDV